MPVGKSSKKTETLEIRLPPETKAAFMARCQASRRTASEALRGFIEQELIAPRVAPRRRNDLLEIFEPANHDIKLRGPGFQRADRGLGAQRERRARQPPE